VGNRARITAQEAEGRDPRPGKADRPPLACYANYFEVGHNAFEFLIDAGQIEPQSGEVQLLSRIALGPVHAKLLAGLLNQSIEQYEESHQPIPELTHGESVADLAFTNPREFERRAIDARRQPARSVPTNPDSNER
jgi:hypothetical protein